MAQISNEMTDYDIIEEILKLLTIAMIDLNQTWMISTRHIHGDTEVDPESSSDVVQEGAVLHNLHRLHHDLTGVLVALLVLLLCVDQIELHDLVVLPLAQLLQAGVATTNKIVAAVKVPVVDLDPEVPGPVSQAQLELK